MSKTDTKFKLAIKEVGHLLNVWLPLRLQYDKVPGVSIAIVYKGKTLYQKGFGYADIESKIKADENTLYHIASISKTFTSVAILQLVDQDKLHLDDPVSKYVTWFKGKNKEGHLEDITIRHLLSNTSGIWRDGNTPHWVTGKFPKDLKSSASKNLIFEPFSEFKYSNYGFSILGEVIQSVTGLSYEKYVQKNILDVLGMNSTAPDYNDRLKNIASGYGRVIPDNTREKFDHYTTNAYAPATGFVSSAVDLAKYLAALPLNASEKILKKKFKREMVQPHRDSDDDDKYCLGIEIYKIGNKKVYGHGGGFNGFITQVAFDQQNELGVVVLTNALRTPVWVYTQSIFQAIYNLVENESDYLSKKKIDGKVYEGIYRNPWGDQVVVKIKDTLLAFDVNTNSPLDKNNKRFLQAKAKNIFSLKGGSGFDSKGEVVKFGDIKNGKTQLVTFGATPSKRIS
jgi:CubicO group peptidase (beta-lactamase class C family)